jgi:hypothetical protein
LSNKPLITVEEEEEGITTLFTRCKAQMGKPTALKEKI